MPGGPSDVSLTYHAGSLHVGAVEGRQVGLSSIEATDRQRREARFFNDYRKQPAFGG